MTESPFTSPAPEAAADEPSTGTQRRTAVLAFGVLGAAVLAGGAYFLLGGEDVPELAVAAPAGAPAVPGAAAPSPAALPVASEVQLGRNPFKALYVQPAPVAAAPDTSSGSSGSGTDTSGGGTGGTGGTGGYLPPSGGGYVPPGGGGYVPPSGGYVPPGGGTPSTPDVSRPPAPVTLHELRLSGVTGSGEEQKAVFTIDGTEVTVAVGATFGPTGHLLLLSIQQGPRADQWTAVVQVGDGDPFDVVTGDPAFVL